TNPVVRAIVVRVALDCDQFTAGLNSHDEAGVPVSAVASGDQEDTPGPWVGEKELMLFGPHVNVGTVCQRLPDGSNAEPGGCSMDLIVHIRGTPLGVVMNAAGSKIGFDLRDPPVRPERLFAHADGPGSELEEFRSQLCRVGRDEQDPQAGPV